MNEFLTDNIRKAYPLERELPDGVGPLWGQLLSDACIGTKEELGTDRLSLLAVRCTGSEILLTLGAGSDELQIGINSGLGEFATVIAASDSIKAILTVNGQIADRIISDGDYATEDPVEIGVPFALRCTSSANRMVMSISAYTPQEAYKCASQQFAGHEHETAAVEISEGDAVLAAKDGVDLEVTELMPLTGDLLRVSAIAAPESAAEADKAVDIMIRGDECFTVETMPGSKVTGGAPVKRTAADPDGKGVLGGGVIRIGTVCKPCCQCDDYKAVIDMLRPQEELSYRIEQMLNDAKLHYDQAITAFNRMKSDAMERINSIANVRIHAVAALSPACYGGVDATGTRERMSVTLYVENMTLVDVNVTGVTFSVDGFTLVAGFGMPSATDGWTRVSGGTTSRGTVLPVRLEPGGTLAVVSTYAKASTKNAADRPSGMTATATVSIDGTSATKTVDIT